jgi:hypothetical protein
VDFAPRLSQVFPGFRQVAAGPSLSNRVAARLAARLFAGPGLDFGPHLYPSRMSDLTADRTFGWPINSVIRFNRPIKIYSGRSEFISIVRFNRSIDLIG